MRLAKFVFRLALAAVPVMLPVRAQEATAQRSVPKPEQAAPAVEIEAKLREGLRNNPQQFDARYALGSFLANQGRLTEAIPYLEQAAALQPQNYACGHDLALALFKTGQLAAASRKVREILEQSDTPELHNLLGAIEEAAGNIDVAAKELQQAAERDPSEKHVFDFGSILLRYRAHDGALKILRFGTERYPRSAQLKVAYGVALYSLGHYEQAVTALCEAVDLDPADSRAFDFLGKLHDISPGMAAEVTGRLKNFVRLYPENASANYYYATSLWKGSGQETEDNVDEVERLLQKAVALEPDFQEAHFQLGTLYERMGRYEAAAHHFRRVTQIQPNLDTPYYRLANVYQRLGQVEAARESIKTYERLHKESQSREKAAQPPALIVK